VSLPSEAEQSRLLERASETIDYVTLERIDTDDDEHILATQKATCAQVEWWLEAGEGVDVSGPIQGYAIGSMQIQYGAGTNRISPTTLAPRARRYLLTAGLLYRGVGAR
jgi:hypothetical protein